jgi:hypothetical protein
MKLTTRFRVRTLMALVALVAVGFGVAFEWTNHAERDRLLKLQLNRYRYAAFHQKRALECQSAEARQLPYRPAERMKLLSDDPTRGWLPGRNFRSWEEESSHHMYWGNRYFDVSQGKFADDLRAVEARLLLP